MNYAGSVFIISNFEVVSYTTCIDYDKQRLLVFAVEWQEQHVVFENIQFVAADVFAPIDGT